MAVNTYFDGYSISSDTNQYANLLDAAVELVTYRGDDADKELDKYFHPLPAESTTMKISDVGSILDLPKENSDEDDLPASTPAPGRNTTFTPVQYRQKVQITSRFMRTDRHGKGVQIASGMPNAVVRKKQYLMALLFTNAFTSGTGADGAYLIADSHDPVNPNGTARDNKGTGALSVDNWHALRLLADKQVDELGYPKPGMIQDLVIPPDLRRKATELTQSRLDPETAQNTPQVLTDFNIKVCHYLSSTTAYFGFNMKIPGIQSGMYFVYLVQGPALADCKPSSNPDIVWAKRSLFDGTYGFSEATERIYGSDGA